MKKFAIALAAALLALPAMAVDFHGYWRLSAGGNLAGGDQVGMDNAASKPTYGANHLRLGNEGDYNEFLLEQQVLKDKNGVEWTSGVMFGFATADGNYDAGFNGLIHFEQLYLNAKFPQLNGATVWAGYKYYHRQDNGIFDYQMLDPHRRGAGIENYDIGFGKLNVAVFKVQGGNGYTSFWDPDVRIEAIPVNPGGTLDVGVLGRIRTWNKKLAGQAATPAVDSVDAPSGTESFSPLLYAIHRQSGILNGGNTLMVSYRTGCYLADGCPKNTNRLIVSEALLLQPAKAFGVTIAGVYAMDKWVKPATTTPAAPAVKVTTNSISVAARPVFQVADHFAIQGDLGYMYNKDDTTGAKANTMIKGTIAPTIIPWTDDFVAGAAPQIRFYASFASWNKEQAAAHKVAAADAKSGVMYGIQAECGF